MSPAPSANVLPPIFTVGHSTRTIPEFLDVLRLGRVDLVVDVRSIPRSRTNPQYNLDTLPGVLAGYQIGHHRIAELGGLRGRAHDVSPEVNAFWQNRSFHNYADHALSEEFAAGLAELLRLSAERRELYAEAHIHVKSGNGAHGEVVDKIVVALDKHLNGRPPTD